MSWTRIQAILMKDLQDAFRDGRILVLLLLPIGMAVFYNATVDDKGELPTAKVAIADPSSVGLERSLKQAASKGIELDVDRARDAAGVRRLIDRGDADLGVVVRKATKPTAQVLVSADADPTDQSLAALVPDALTRAAGLQPAADISTRAVTPADRDAVDIVGQREVTVVISIVLLAAFIAMLVVPMQTAEELETGTFGALRLAATGPEVLTAKAVAGALYSAAGVVLTVVLTQLEMSDPLLFIGAVVGLAVSLIGFGLLLGLVVGNVQVINTYGGFALIPLVGLAVAVFFVDRGGTFASVLDALPFSQATRLMGDGLSDEKPFDAGATAWAVIAAWAVVGYAALARYAARREL